LVRIGWNDHCDWRLHRACRYSKHYRLRDSVNHRLSFEKWDGNGYNYRTNDSASSDPDPNANSTHC
jgi:hypothetical protein